MTDHGFSGADEGDEELVYWALDLGGSTIRVGGWVYCIILLMSHFVYQKTCWALDLVSGVYCMQYDLREEYFHIVKRLRWPFDWALPHCMMLNDATTVAQREPVMHLYGLWYMYPARCPTTTP
jgi:hypothetical protein